MSESTSGSGGGFARAIAPGTRIGRMLGENSELWLNIKFAVAVAIASDVILLVLLLTTLKVGWLLLVPVGTLCGLLVGLAGLWSAQMLRIGLTRFVRFMLGSLWVIGTILGGVAWAYGRWRIDPMLRLMGLQLSEVYALDWWWYALGIVAVLFVTWLIRKWWVPLMTAVTLSAIGVAAFSDPEVWRQIGRVLSWMGLPFLWPFGGAATILIPVMLREMFFPNAEFTLAPVKLQELGLGGLASFYLPWLSREPEALTGAEPVPYLAQGTLETENGYVYLEFELESFASARRWHKFCKAVTYGKKNFSYNEAVKRHKVSDADWDNLLDAFAAQQWVILAAQRGTPTLMAIGKHWVKLYADTPPPKP